MNVKKPGNWRRSLAELLIEAEILSGLPGALTGQWSFLSSTLEIT
jgi:hypothetical protein